MSKCRAFDGQIIEFYETELGDYKIVERDGVVHLLHKEKSIMSNSDEELEDNREVVEEARDDVFIAGLGLGLILLPIQDKKEVTSVTVLEISPDVIKLVGSQLPLNDKVKIVQGDVFDYKPKGKFDTLYFDISGKGAERGEWFVEEYSQYKKDEDSWIGYYQPEVPVLPPEHFESDLPVRWVKCGIKGTGTEEDPFRPDIDVPEGTPWTAAYHPNNPPYQSCLVRVQSKLAVNNEIKENKDWDKVYEETPSFKKRWLDQPVYPTEKHTVTETRYCREDTHEINGLTHYQLGTSQTSTEKLGSYNLGGDVTAYFNSHVYKRTPTTTTTIASSVAGTSRSTDGGGIQSATWNCPETALDEDDAVIVRQRWWMSGETPTTDDFITEVLGATGLAAETWTFYRYTMRLALPRSTDRRCRVQWGDSTNDTRIENFAYEEPAVDNHKRSAFFPFM